VSSDIYEHGVPGGALGLKSTNYPDQGHHGDRPLLGKIPTAGPEIEPGTSCLVVRSPDHQVTRLVAHGILFIINAQLQNESQKTTVI
jgi:hypothetical protein